MGSSFYIVTSLIMLVIAVILGFCARNCFRKYQKINQLLKRESEMSATTTGTISDLVTVTRRNRSFRWKNQYPIISYQVNGQEYKVTLDYAEKRMGSYQMGGSYQIYYIPSEPENCIIDYFKKDTIKCRRSNLISTVLLAIFAVNLIFGIITTLTTASL